MTRAGSLAELRRAVTARRTRSAAPDATCGCGDGGEEDGPFTMCAVHERRWGKLSLDTLRCVVVDLDSGYEEVEAQLDAALSRLAAAPAEAERPAASGPGLDDLRRAGALIEQSGKGNADYRAGWRDALEAVADERAGSHEPEGLEVERLARALITGTDHPDMDPLLEPESARFYAERIAAAYVTSQEASRG